MLSLSTSLAATTASSLFVPLLHESSLISSLTSILALSVSAVFISAILSTSVLSSLISKLMISSSCSCLSASTNSSSSSSSSESSSSSSLSTSFLEFATLIASAIIIIKSITRIIPHTARIIVLSSFKFATSACNAVSGFCASTTCSTVSTGATYLIYVSSTGSYWYQPFSPLSLIQYTR